MIRRKNKMLIKKIGMIILTAATALNAAGCKTTELEDRTFPMLAAADYDEETEEVGFSYVFPVQRAEPDAVEEAGDKDVAMAYAGEFDEAFWVYETKLNKVADYNHLKVFLMSETFVENKKQYDDMLSMFWEEETFPRNTYVCVTDDIQAVLKAEEGLSVDLGTYIEELLKSHTKGNETKLTTLGNLMDEKENQLQDWELPYLTVEEETIVWSDVYLLRQKSE